MRITPSTLRTWDACPKQLWYRDVQGIPTQDRDYFEYGRKTERILYAMILHVLKHPAGVTFHAWEHQDDGAPGPEEAKENLRSPEWRNAHEMFLNRDFRKYLAEGGHIHLQPTLKRGGLEGHPDIVNDLHAVDVKTSAGPWTNANVQENGWQARGYPYLTGKKPFAFLVANKATFQVQFIRTNADPEKAAARIADAVAAVKLARETGCWPAKPSPRACSPKFCSYSAVCDRNGVTSESGPSLPKEPSRKDP